MTLVGTVMAPVNPIATEVVEETALVSVTVQVEVELLPRLVGLQVSDAGARGGDKVTVVVGLVLAEPAEIVAV